MPLTNSPGYSAPPGDPLSSGQTDSQKRRRMFSRLRLILLCLAVVAILLAALEFVAPNYGSVSGTVRDLDGNPLPVQVAIVGQAETTRTNGSGRFVLSHIPSGQQTLTIQYDGSDLAFQIDVPDEGSLNIGQIQVDTGT